MSIFETLEKEYSTLWAAALAEANGDRIKALLLIKGAMELVRLAELMEPIS